MFASPDVGGSKRVSAYAKRLGTDFAIINKQRARANVVDTMTLIGDVKDRNVILVDDIIDTAGTIVKAGQLIMDSGAKSVRAIATTPFAAAPPWNASTIQCLKKSSSPIPFRCQPTLQRKSTYCQLPICLPM